MNFLAGKYLAGTTWKLKPIAMDSLGVLQLGSTGSAAVTLKANSDGELQLANYTSLTQSNRSEEIDPISQHYAYERLANASSQGNGTTYYYVDMAGYQHLSLSFDDTPGVAGDQTYTVEACLEADGTAPASCAPWIDVSNAWYGAASWTTDAFLAADAAKMAGSAKYVRVKVVRANDGGNTDGAWVIDCKRWY